MFVKQLKELNVDIPLTTVEAFEYSEQLDLFEGCWYVQAAEPLSDFIVKYESKYGKKPTVGSANAYDIFNLIVLGFEKKGRDKENVASYLLTVQNYSGALGTLKVQEDGRIWSEAVVKEIKNGNPVLLRR